MSSPASFVTARQAQSSLLTPDDSSPPGSEPEPVSDDFTYHHPQAPLHRPTKPLTYQLRTHSLVYLDGQQYLDGFTLLDSLLVAGNSISTPENPHPALLPPPQYLALASTLIVYPSLTTKAKSFDKQKAANSALHYLRNVSKVVDPSSDALQTAFAFATPGSTRRAGRGRGEDSPDGLGETKLTTNVANAGSIWTRAEDFWHIVGWAFNCSVAYKNRWERWKLWLELMLDFVEADWNKRMPLFSTANSDDHIATLIWRYIASQEPQSRTTRRRILRAILADGTSKAMKEFTEVFKDEAKERKQDEEAVIKVQKPLDIDNDEFGDYDLSEDEDAVMEDTTERASTRPSRKASRQKESSTSSEYSSDEDEDGREARDPVERLGGMDAIKLRQRLLHLLVDVAAATGHLSKAKKMYSPAPFSTADDLFDLYTEFLRPLPTSVFSIFLSTSKLDPSAQARLNTTLLIPLLPANPSEYYPLPDQSQFEEHYLPFAANTHSYGDNAKISLIFESLFIQMMKNNALQPSKELRQAVEEGVAARQAKAYGDARRKQRRESEEAAAKDILKMSQERLLGLVEILELSSDDLPSLPSNASTPRGVNQAISSPLSSAISDHDIDAMEH
ncbi:uncharacterized protein BDZ99DRAFT_518325 [Mytilinidion resinicola]|uniref:Uncharacterized protein n=1 Tax=Mytilinidion resinicola TaxID=574789 RepID=A0A6A6YUQ4_9PEZI|nr:uncharacterized protein BDZ99DRAFT_518325 [Mytilinidion resinicola]KAF2812490.1 hypothetical protein BDZ99DRAFT_518325 [Mytilinidion resinicola]